MIGTAVLGHYPDLELGMAAFLLEAAAVALAGALLGIALASLLTLARSRSPTMAPATRWRSPSNRTA